MCNVFNCYNEVLLASLAINLPYTSAVFPEVTDRGNWFVKQSMGAKTDRIFKCPGFFKCD